MNEELPILSADGVSKRFGGVHALEEVSFVLHPGEVLALAGDNGAGKSTLIKVISGVHRADDGHVTFRGQRLELSSPREARELGIETIYQDLALADNLDVAGNFFLGRERMRRFLGFLPRLDRASMRESSLQAIESLDIHLDRADVPVRDLSGGQRQAVAISRAIFWNAALLIMDEPTAALGVPEQRKVIELIRRLRERKVSIIFISHNLQDIFAVADRILVLRRGKKVLEKNASETDSEEVVRFMVGG